MATNDPTAPLRERTPEQVAEYVDSHVLQALMGAEHPHGDRQVAEDYVRDRLVALSDTFPTAAHVAAECSRRTLARLSQVIGR